MRRIFNIAVIALAVASVLASCKKKDESSSKSYLSGSLELVQLSPYQKVGDEVTVTVKGVSHPEGHLLHIAFSFNDKKDTLDVEYTGEAQYKITIPEKIGDYTLRATVIPSDYDHYYESSSSAIITAVDPSLSVPQIAYNPEEDGLLVDSRDNISYPYSTVGGVCWMKRSLAYAQCGASYYNPVMDSIFGRYYTWNEAQTACPEGWQLPTDQDFVDLANHFTETSEYKLNKSFAGAAGYFILLATFNGERLWPYNPYVQLATEQPFNALPAGYINVAETDFTRRYSLFGENALFWTADQKAGDASQALFRMVNLDSPDVMIGAADKASMALSVRCIKK